MLDLFICYSREDREVAEKLAATLQEESWDIFWDRKIDVGAEWNDEVHRALREARCVLVIWPATSRKSLWVIGEAADAYDRDAYLPFSIDGVSPPRLFNRKQPASLEEWVARGDHKELNKLKTSVRPRFNPLPMYGNLEPVGDSEEQGKEPHCKLSSSGSSHLRFALCG